MLPPDGNEPSYRPELFDLLLVSGLPVEKLACHMQPGILVPTAAVVEVETDDATHATIAGWPQAIPLLPGSPDEIVSGQDRSLIINWLTANGISPSTLSVGTTRAQALNEIIKKFKPAWTQ